MVRSDGVRPESRCFDAPTQPSGRIKSREHRRSRRRHHGTRHADVQAPAPTTPTAPAAPTWQLEPDNGSLRPRSALDVLVDLNDKVTTGQVSEYQPVPLGFTPLDKTIGTGLRAGELLLIGGAQGTGKTTMALQMARTSRPVARPTSCTSASSTTSSTCSTA